jgi:hypothetical protein
MLLGTAAATTVALATPAMAQVGFYIGPGGAGIEFGAPHGYYSYYDDDYYAPRYYSGRRYHRHRDTNDSYWRWRREGYPYFETER